MGKWFSSIEVFGQSVTELDRHGRRLEWEEKMFKLTPEENRRNLNGAELSRSFQSGMRDPFKEQKLYIFGPTGRKKRKKGNFKKFLAASIPFKSHKYFSVDAIYIAHTYSFKEGTAEDGSRMKKKDFPLSALKRSNFFRRQNIYFWPLRGKNKSMNTRWRIFFWSTQRRKNTEIFMSVCLFLSFFQ